MDKTVVVQLPGPVWLSVTSQTQIPRLPCPLPSPRICPSSCPLNWWCHPTISSSVVPFSSCLQSFPAPGSFPMSHFFTSGGQSIGVSASASVLPMSFQGSFPLRLTGLIFLCLKDSQDSSLAQFKSINSLVLCIFYGPTLTSIQNYWKNHSFDYTDLCQQSDVSALLSRFIIAFLPRRKRLLISWLQSLSAVILEPKKIKIF